MTLNITKLNCGEKGRFKLCRDIKKTKELIAYGFINDVQVEVVSKTKHSVVVRVLDGLYTLNYKLAENIVVEVN